MSRIHLASNLSLPVDVVTESIAILARKRAGKSYTARKLVEQLHKANQQVVIVDPKGDWWGIRSSADGRLPGLPFVILGGEHGDIPLEASGGELVARLAAQERVSMLLDLSDFRKHEVATFMTGFLEPLYRLKAKDEFRTSMTLAIDEADAIAPQKPMKGEERMLGAAEDIVRRGGQRGIGIILVTQRAAVLNKNVLTQAGIIVLLTTTGSQDIDALEEWIKKHGRPEEKAKVMETIASMPRGTAWFWSPGWPDEDGIFKQIQIAEIETFDSGATPKPGERRIAPKTVADVDLKKFHREMAATIERKKQEDPKELRARVATLQRELAEAKAARPVRMPVPKRVEVPILKEAHVKRLETVADKWARGAEALARTAADVTGSSRALIEAITKAKDGASQPLAPADQVFPRPLTAYAPTQSRQRHEPTPRVSRLAVDGINLKAGERRMFEAVATWHPRRVTRKQAALQAGISNANTISSYATRLKLAGLVDEVSDGLELTEAGYKKASAAGLVGRAPTTTEGMLQHFGGVLKAGERRMLEEVVRAWPRELGREDLARKAGIDNWNTVSSYVTRLRQAGLVTTSGQMVKASDELFPELSAIGSR